VWPVDELPAGEQAPAHVEAGTERTPGGRWTKGARTAQSKGGKARRGTTHLSHEAGLGGVDGDEAFAPYRSDARHFTRAQCAALAASVGGGHCGPGPSSIVASAALALAASRYLYDTANGDPKALATAARLADSSRASLRDAHALAALEAEARPKSSSIVALRERLGGGNK
jgi:hypothetical protein